MYLPGRCSAAGRGRTLRHTATAVGPLAVGILLAVAACVQDSLAKEAVTWIQSYDEAIEEARRTGKPIFLEFRCAP